MKIKKNASTCSGGACICSGGAFLLFSLWSLCFAQLVTFLCLSLVLVMSCASLFFFLLLSFSEFHFALFVVNALIKGEIEDQERWWSMDDRSSVMSN
jgi:hypothetical protein